MLDCKTYNWRFKKTEVLSKETYMLNIFLASQFVRKFQNDHLLHYSSGIIWIMVYYTFVTLSFFMYIPSYWRVYYHMYDTQTKQRALVAKEALW